MKFFFTSQLYAKTVYKKSVKLLDAKKKGLRDPLSIYFGYKQIEARESSFQINQSRKMDIKNPK